MFSIGETNCLTSDADADFCRTSSVTPQSSILTTHDVSKICSINNFDVLMIFSRVLRPCLLSAFIKPYQVRTMHIQSIPMCKFWIVFAFVFPSLTSILGVGSSNNYAYLVSDETTKDAVIIDPANPPE